MFSRETTGKHTQDNEVRSSSVPIKQKEKIPDGHHFRPSTTNNCCVKRYECSSYWSLYTNLSSSSSANEKYDEKTFESRETTTSTHSGQTEKNKNKERNGPFPFGYSHVCVSLKGKNDITVLPGLHFVFVWDLCGLISFYTSHVPAAA